MRRNPIGRSEDLPERGALRFRVRDAGAEADAFVIRVDGEARAFLNVCTHRAMELDLGTGRFFTQKGDLLQCLAHGAVFSLSGDCVGGLCRRGTALTKVEVIEEGGVLYALEAEDAPPV